MRCVLGGRLPWRKGGVLLDLMGVRFPRATYGKTSFEVDKIPYCRLSVREDVQR